MKANELMIGDWVYNPFTRKTLRLTFGRDIDLAEGLCLEPIPLTDAILKSNGFEYFHKNIASLSHENPLKLELVEWPDENRDGGLWVVGGIIKIRFVHELQHLLLQCGIKKEINL